MGAPIPNLTFIMCPALETNQEVAAKFMKEQNRGPQQMGRDRQGLRKQPDRSLISTVVEVQLEEFKARAERGRRKQPLRKYGDQLKKGKNGPVWRPGGKYRFRKGSFSEGGGDYDSGWKRRQRKAATDEGKAAEAQSAARGKIGRGATEGGEKTTPDLGNETRPVNKRGGRLLGTVLWLGEG